MVDFLNNVTGDQYQRVRSDGTEDTEGNRGNPANATGEDIDHDTAMGTSDETAPDTAGGIPTEPAQYATRYEDGGDHHGSGGGFN